MKRLLSILSPSANSIDIFEFYNALVSISESTDILLSIKRIIFDYNLSIYQKNIFYLVLMSDDFSDFLKDKEVLMDDKILDDIVFSFKNNTGSLNSDNFFIYLTFLKISNSDFENEVIVKIKSILDDLDLDVINQIYSSILYLDSTKHINRPLRDIRVFINSELMEKLKGHVYSLLNSKLLFKANNKARKADNYFVFIFKQFSPLLRNTETKLVLDYIFSLLRCGVCGEVEILITNELVLDNKNFSLGAVPFNKIDLLEHARVRGYEEGLLSRLKITYLNEIPLKKKYRNFLIGIQNYLENKNPTVIISTCYREWPLMALLMERYPIVYFSILNGLYPPYKYHSAVVPKVSGNNYRSSDVSQSYIYFYEDWITRESASLYNDNNKAYITIAVELLKRISNSDIISFFDFVEEELVKGWSWSILGCSEDELKVCFGRRFDQFLENERLRVYKYYNELDELLEKHTILVNPPVAGGGRGVAQAARIGLKAVCHIGSDAANFLPEEALYSSFSEIREVVKKVEGVDFLDIFGPSYNKKCLSDFVHSVDLAKEIYENSEHVIF